MIREVDLVSYLPPFMAAYREDKAALEAENPEFNLVWGEVERLYNNEFILDADEYGISRFERLLKLRPYDTDDLETRRLRVLAEWFKTTPYTLPWLRAWMRVLCGGTEGHTETVNDYTLSVWIDRTVIEYATEIRGIMIQVLPPVIPANIVLEIGRIWHGTATVHAGAYLEYCPVLEVWPGPVGALSLTTESIAAAATRFNPKINIYPEPTTGLILNAGAQAGSAVTVRKRMEVYPNTPVKIEGVTGGAGAVMRMPREMSVYPGTIARIEGTAENKTGGALSARNTLEIYPE